MLRPASAAMVGPPGFSLQLKLTGHVDQPAPTSKADKTSRGLAATQATRQTHLGDAESNPPAHPKAQPVSADSRAWSAGSTHQVTQVNAQLANWHPALAYSVRCPFHLCNAPMSVKADTNNGDFLSCSQYPACKGMRRMDGTLIGEPKAIFMDSNHDIFMVSIVKLGTAMRAYRCKACGNFSVRAIDSNPNTYDKCEVLPCAAPWTSPPPESSVHYRVSASISGSLGGGRDHSNSQDQS